METAALVVFSVCFLLCAYVYFGYPALIHLLCRLRARPVKKAPVQPTVSIIVAARNEEEVIGEKIRNSLASEYDTSRLEVVVACNGCTDSTQEIVGGWVAEGHPVRLEGVAEIGKAFALNAAAAVASGEILVFTDANTALDPDALARLVESYADPEVGGGHRRKSVQAESASDATAEGEGVYWRYELWQKAQESCFGSCYIGDGALHSIRRELYVPVSDPARGDDISISTRAVIQGFRLIYEPRAVAREREKTEGATSSSARCG